MKIFGARTAYAMKFRFVDATKKKLLKKIMKEVKHCAKRGLRKAHISFYDDGGPIGLYMFDHIKGELEAWGYTIRVYPNVDYNPDTSDEFNSVTVSWENIWC